MTMKKDFARCIFVKEGELKPEILEKVKSEKPTYIQFIKPVFEDI